MIEFADILAFLSGAAVGLVLALIGGGGSILATPALLYIVGVSNPHMAIGTSALAVSINAFANLITHARRGNVKWRCTILFGGAGVVGAAFGAGLGRITSAEILLPLFAVLMIVIGVAMPAAASRLGRLGRFRRAAAARPAVILPGHFTSPALKPIPCRGI